MYDELVKKVRHCVTDPMHCLSCDEDKDGRCFKRLMTHAADAIEELQGKIEEFYYLVQDVNRNEIIGHISENNLDSWLYAFQRYAARIARKPLPEPPKEG